MSADHLSDFDAYWLRWEPLDCHWILYRCNVEKMRFTKKATAELWLDELERLRTYEP